MHMSEKLSYVTFAKSVGRFTTRSFARAVVATVIAAATWGHAEEAETEVEQSADEGPRQRHTLTLESTIVGDKEQPAVSYFIPWKDVGTPDKLQWNIDKKHDDTLDLLDRDVMLRSMQVYDQMGLENPEPQ